jgi:type II secretory pathway component PulK
MNDSSKQLAQLAERCLKDERLAEQLCDRIYNQLQSDLRVQQERVGNPSTGRH